MHLGKKKKEAEQIRKEETKTLKFIVGGVVILAIALLALLHYRAVPTTTTTPETTEDLLVAKVNGQEILNSQLEKQYERLPAQFKQVLTKEQVLGQMIDEILLLQRAKELGIQVSDEEIKTRIQEFLKQSKVTQQIFDESLQRQGISAEEVNELFRKQITIQQVMEKELGKQLEVSDKEVLDYFNDNSQEFMIPASTKVRHILIAFENKTPEETEEEAHRIRALIKPNYANFCELVQDYSADEASKKTCGEYTYTADTQFVPEFKEAGEKQGANQISIVKTQFGYHIIQTLAKLPERLPKFEDLRADIEAGLKAQKQRVLLRKYVEKLRTEGTIENKISNEVSQPAEAEEETAQKTAEPTEAKTEMAPETTKPENLNNLALCLSKNKATLYGMASNAETKKQLNLFGTAGQYLNFVDCSYLGNPNIVKKECSQAGIKTYPTWIISGAKKEGVQEPKALAALTGCGM